MISQIFPNLIHDMNMIRCHIFSNFNKRRKITPKIQVDVEPDSLMSQVKPNWIMRKQLPFPPTIKWELIFI